MITLDPRTDAGIVRDIVRPCTVVVQDPTGQHVHFGVPRLAEQLRVHQQGDTVLRHFLQLPGGARMQAPPAWVTECPEEVVPLPPGRRLGPIHG